MSNPTAAQGAAAAAPATARRQSTAESLAASADLEEALVSPTTATASSNQQHGTSAAAADEAERARAATQAWRPAIDRRQSWNKEEHKRSMQMSAIADVKEGAGFTERAQ